VTSKNARHPRTSATGGRGEGEGEGVQESGNNVVILCRYNVGKDYTAEELAQTIRANPWIKGMSLHKSPDEKKEDEVNV
jgi:hypothetical protein